MTFDEFEDALEDKIPGRGRDGVHLGAFAPTSDAFATASYHPDTDTVAVDAAGTDYTAEYYPERFYDFLASAYEVPPAVLERADLLLRLRAEHNRASAAATTVE